MSFTPREPSGITNEAVFDRWLREKVSKLLRIKSTSTVKVSETADGVFLHAKQNLGGTTPPAPTGGGCSLATILCAPDINGPAAGLKFFVAQTDGSHQMYVAKPTVLRQKPGLPGGVPLGTDWVILPTYYAVINPLPDALYPAPVTCYITQPAAPSPPQPGGGVNLPPFYWSAATSQRYRSGNIATLTVPNHCFIDGQEVTVFGLGGTGYNLTDVGITWLSVNTFSYPCTGGDEAATPDTGGTAQGLLTITWQDLNPDARKWAYRKSVCIAGTTMYQLFDASAPYSP